MNKSYVVIGGSSGIGRELVQLLEKEGNNVFATYHENIINSQGNIQWKWNGSLQLFEHSKNVHGDSVYYFISLGKDGKRIQKLNSNYVANTTTDIFDERWVMEKDTINILNSGQIWWGPAMGLGVGLLQRSLGGLYFSEQAYAPHILRAGIIGKALAEVDRFVLNGQSAHDSEYRCAYVREFALYGWFQCCSFWFFVKSNQSLFNLPVARLRLL